MREPLVKELYVRGEKKSDYNDIFEINRLAFGREDEGKLVNDVRKTKNYEFGFSLVAIKEEKIIGHVLFSKAFIVHRGRRFKCLALGPIAVHPEHQRKGIGKILIEEGLERAKEVGFGAVVVLGDPVYYEKFGFKPAAGNKLRVSFGVPAENFLVKEINKNSLRGIIGTVQYAREFLVLADADKKRAEQKAKEELAAGETNAEIETKVNTETNVNNETINNIEAITNISEVPVELKQNDVKPDDVNPGAETIMTDNIKDPEDINTNP